MASGMRPIIDLSAALDLLGADLCCRVPELAHIDLRRVLFGLARSRAEGHHGVYARIVPLRFAGGAAERTRRRGRYLETFRLPGLVHEGREILYLIHLLVPRFLRLSFEQKLATVIHELYHISERCDGDLRRFPGRNFAHGASRRAFNRTVAGLQERYLAAGPDPALLDFLHLTETGWLRREFRLTGLSTPLPRARLIARERL
jgi:hypothetical protein